MKKIEDYLPMYLGCNLICEPYGITEDSPENLVCVHWYFNTKYDKSTSLVTYKGEQKCIETRLIKPILRPLSSMTEEEKQEAVKTIYNGGTAWDNINDAVIEFDQQCDKNILFFHYLLSKHFDLFGLIDAGLAIDSTSLTPITGK